MCVYIICEKKLSTSFHSAHIIINDFACPVSICYLVAYTTTHTCRTIHIFYRSLTLQNIFCFWPALPFNVPVHSLFELE